jgi:phytoene dehydrogenase-like protein
MDEDKEQILGVIRQMAKNPKSEYNAVIIGAGHIAIVTGVYLAKAGWKVLILERNKVPGGAVQIAEVTIPGFRHDLFATNLNLFANSPFYAEFKSELHRNGLEFVRSSKAFSSVFPDGDYLGISQDMTSTVQSIREVYVQDAENWQLHT